MESKCADVRWTQQQQGDVCIRAIAALPAGIEMVPQPRVILARGEVTGHMHVAEGPDLAVGERDGVLYLRVGLGRTTVRHEEHTAQTLAPDLYGVEQVREYDYLAEMTRRVTD